ncbi:MAG: class IV adenylate cyclase [Halobacteriales archaeon SW_9_67_24]|nr:MAG: class IV adenylate cyclase [Halobacteriales archaeon SW_9_67_24]
MYEVELKVQAAHEPIREALAAREATRLGTVRQADTYYDAPHRSFADTDEALRLRHETREGGTEEREGDTAEDEREMTHLAYKGPLIEAASKTREEAETAVADPDATGAILAALGFAPAARVTKHRERFVLGAYTVALDSVEDLGTFVEVERTVEADDGIGAARDGARELLADLGLDPDDQIRTSYLELLLDAPDADGSTDG